MNRLRELTEASRAFANATTSEEVIELAVTFSASLLRATSVVLLLENAHTRTLRVRGSIGADSTWARQFECRFDETVHGKLEREVGGCPPRSPLYVPIVLRGRVAGLLAAFRDPEEVRGKADEWLLSALCDQASVALESATLSVSAQRKDRALATLSHDVRTPLQTILMAAEFLASEKPGTLTDHQRRKVETIRASAHHLHSLVTSILEVAVLRSGTKRLENRAVPVSAAVEDAVLLVSSAAHAKSQTVSVRTEPIVAAADPTGLRQVLVNLLTNAVAYTPAGGQIEVTATLEGGRIRIEVKDNGRGIDAQHLESIFEPYFRVTPGEGPGGSGLGLAIAREMMRRMAGDLQVASTSGVGSCFTVVLDAAHEESPAPQP